MAGPSSGQVVGTTSVQMLPANNQRYYLLVSNLGPNVVYMAFGTSNAATTTNGFPIPVGGNYESPLPAPPPNGDVSCVTAAGTSTVIAYDR